MKRVFISQPMGGKTKEEIIDTRNRAIISIKEKYGENIKIIDSFFENVPQNIKPLWVLSKSIELLSTADIAYFVKEWENCRGCRVEHQCAIEYGINIIEE